MITQSLPRFGWWWRVASLGGVCLLGGCAALAPKNDPTKFYTLPPTQVATATSVGAWQGLPVGLERIELPDYLQSRQIVQRLAGPEVRFMSAHRWAEALDGALAWHLAAALENQLGARVETIPWNDGFAPLYRLRVMVERFEGTDEGALVAAQWEVLRPDGGGAPLASGQWRQVVPIADKGDPAALVVGLGDGLDRLAQRVAESLQEARRNAP